MRRILSIDGGGIRGVFPAAFLATVEASANVCIADNFDLIVGTSTGGIIAIGLGLGIPASEILHFYEAHGPQIFPKQRAGWLRWLQGAKYDSSPLRSALTSLFGDKRLGDSKTRLVIPSVNLNTGEVHVYKTSHHERLQIDYRAPAVEVALATCAAPTYFQEHIDGDGLSLVDGGLWANNPVGIAAVEAIGVLDWKRDDIEILSIGCTTSPLAKSRQSPKWKGAVFYATRLLDIAGTAQSSGSLGSSQILLGSEHVHRYTTVVDRGTFSLDGTTGISSLRGLGADSARTALPLLKIKFLSTTTEPFSPNHSFDSPVTTTSS